MLDDGEQLGLQGQAEVAYLVQEERAALCGLQPSGLAAAGIGEGTPLVAEELALEQRVGDAPQVDGDVWFVPAGRGLAGVSRQQVLARAVLA